MPHSSCLKVILFLFVLLFFGSQTPTATAATVSDRQPPMDEPVIPVFLMMEDADLNRLYRRNPRSDDRLPGFVRWGERGRVQGLNGVRFRGNTSRYHVRKSFNIRFNRPQRELFGSDRLNLNAMFTDPSGMRERLAWQMFHELGQPASKVRYVAMHINGNYEGLGLHIQRIDEILLRQNGLDPRGTLVRDFTRRRGAEAGLDRRSIFGFDLNSVADKPAFLAGMFESRWSPDYNAIAELLQWVHDTPAGDAFEQGLRERFDVENLTDWLAIHYLIGDVDAFGDDFWLYRGRGATDKWKIIPWDHDLSFGRNEREGLTENRELGQFGRGLVQLNDFFAYEYPLDDAGWDNALIVKYHQSPGLRAQFEERILFLMDEVFTEAWFDAQIETLEQVIAPYMTRTRDGSGAFTLHERQHHGEPGRWAYHKENLRDFVALRYAFIRSMLLFDEPTAFHNHARLQFTEGQTGRVLITDDAGWTFGALDLETGSITGHPELLIYLRTAPENDGILKDYHVEVTGGSIHGRLTLYYRNDIAPDGRDNWYPYPEAIGRQWELLIVQDEAWLNSRPNPFSNKITAETKLSSTHVLRILHSE